MRTKIIIFLILYTSINSCASEKRSEGLTANKERNDSTIKIPAAYYGYWISENYLKDLKATKSTKKAQELGRDDIIRIYDVNTIMRMNLHEGAAENKLQMTNINTGMIVDPVSNKFYNDIEFSSNKLTLDGVSYIKIAGGDDYKKIYDLINKIIIAGKYQIDGKLVEFLDNGLIKGLDSIKSYTLNLDYGDAGMQYDKIYLQFNNEKEERAYIYEINNNALSIIEIKCEEKDPEDDWCLVIDKGTTKYKLTKK